MDVTFSPLPLAVGGRGDSFTFMVEDFDLDGGAHHASPNRDTTVPSSPMGVGSAQSGSLLGSGGSLKIPPSTGRRNSFDWAANGSGRHRSLSFEFFNMDASSSSSASFLHPGGPGGQYPGSAHSNFSSVMSPEDALLMAATPKGMSSLKRKHLPFSSHYVASSSSSSSGNVIHMGHHAGMNGMGMIDGVGNSYYPMSGVMSGHGLVDHLHSSYPPLSSSQPKLKKQKKEKKEKKERKPRAPKLNPDGTKIEKKKKPKKVRGPRKTRAKKNEEPIELFDPSIPRIGIYTLEQRAEKIKKWMSKARRRIWDKKIKYGCRKRLADARPRFKGRFVKSLPEEKLSIQKLDGTVDPEFLAAQEATRLWKLRQAATVAAAAAAATAAATGMPAAVVAATTPAVTAPASAPPAPPAPPAPAASSFVVAPAPAPSSSSMSNPQTGTPPSSAQPEPAFNVQRVTSSDSEGTPKSPVTVTVTKQVPSSSSLCTQEKITFADQMKPISGIAPPVAEKVLLPSQPTSDLHTNVI